MAYKYQNGSVAEVPDGTQGSFATKAEAWQAGYAPPADPRDSATYTDASGIKRNLNGALVDHDREISTGANNQRTDVAPGDDFNAGGSDFTDIATSLQQMDDLGIDSKIRVENQNRIFGEGQKRYEQLIAQGMPPFQAREQARVWMNGEVEKVKTQYIPGYTPGAAYTPRQTPTSASTSGAPQATKPAAASASTGGILSAPGAGEKWFADHKGAYEAPTRLGEYWEGKAGDLANTNTAGAFQKAKIAYAQPQQGVQNAQGIATDLHDRTAGETTLNQAKNYFTQPNQTLAYQKQVGGVFGQEGQAETYAKNNTAGMQSSGQGGQNAYKTMGGFSTPGAAETNNTQAQATLGANNSAKQFNQGLTQSGFANKNTSGDEMGYFSPDLRAKSRSEDLYDSGQGGKGLTTYYDREAQKRTKALSDQMSAMGVFGSGATARGLYELNADIGASQARDMAGMAAQADQAFLGRAGAAQSFAGQTGDEAIKRQGLGLQAATAADESTRGNVTVGNQAAQNAQAASVDRMFKGGQLGLQADAEARQRLELGGMFADKAQSQQLDRLKTGGDLAKAADASVIDQGRGLADVGTAQSTQELNRLKQSADTGLAADLESRNRLNDYFGQAQKTDTGNLDLEKFKAGVATDADAQDYARLQGGQAAATGAQNSNEQRERYPLQDKQAVATQMSNLVSSARGKSADEQAQIYEQVIQSYIASAGVDRAAAENMAQQMFQSAGIIIQARSAAKK